MNAVLILDDNSRAVTRLARFERQLRQMDTKPEPLDDRGGHDPWFRRYLFER